MADKLKYPKRGYLFEKSLKGIQTRVSCTSMGQKPHLRNHFIVGSEGGYVFNCELEPVINDNTYKPMLDKKMGKVAWDSEAICFMSNISKDVSGGTLFTKIRFEIEDYAKKSNLDTITIDVIMNAKPEISQFYDNPIKDEFESHHGIVKKLEINPKYENYFLTFAYDNTLRIYRDHNRDPLLVLNFDQEITMACWVPINPNLIVVALMDGSLSFYDLSISFEEP